MARDLLLASASPIRLELLKCAGLTVSALPARLDEEAIRDALLAEGAKPRDMADVLAEMKAAKLANSHPDTLVIGCDQVLEVNGRCLGKAHSVEEAREQLAALRGQTHMLHSALVVVEGSRPVWRHIGTARMTMRDFSDSYLDDYLARNWPEISGSVGCYLYEKEGIRLFSNIAGDYHTILGLPLLPLLSWLALRGFIAS